MLHVIFACAPFVASLLIAQAADSPADSFGELGSLFLWGMLGAIALALLVVLIRLRLQARREASSDYVSINPSKHGNES